MEALRTYAAGAASSIYFICDIYSNVFRRISGFRTETDDAIAREKAIVNCHARVRNENKRRRGSNRSIKVAVLLRGGNRKS